MLKLKVYGGMRFNEYGKQDRCVIAARSKVEVTAILGTTYYEVLNFWSETHNQEETAKALDNPRKLIWMDRF